MGKSKKLNDAFIDSDAVLIITEWKEYSNMNWQEIASKMRSPGWVFDARSMVDPKKSN